PPSADLSSTEAYLAMGRRRRRRQDAQRVTGAEEVFCMHPLPRELLTKICFSDQQTDAGTIASQVAALEERLQRDDLALDPELRFIDEGYSGSTLVRPALERLRDATANGAIDRLYVHSPDRLARKYAYQVLLVDEFQRCSVELVFLNRELGRSPEDDLL